MFPRFSCSSYILNNIIAAAMRQRRKRFFCFRGQDTNCKSNVIITTTCFPFRALSTQNIWRLSDSYFQQCVFFWRPLSSLWTSSKHLCSQIFILQFCRIFQVKCHRLGFGSWKLQWFFRGILLMFIIQLSYEKVKTFKYVVSLLPNQNSIHEEIKCRLKTGNSCHYPVQTLMYSRLLSKNLDNKIYKTIILSVVLCGLLH